MADSSQLFKDDEKEQGGQSDASDEAWNDLTSRIDPDEQDAMEREAHNGAAQDIAEREGLFNPNGDGGEKKGQEDDKSGGQIGAGALASAEGAAGIAGQLGKGFTTNNPIGKLQAVKNVFWGSQRRRRATVGGSIAGALVTGSFFGLTFLSGPFEFIHIAQLLEQFHFAGQQDESDVQLARLIRYTSKSESYRTNLGYLGNKLADTFEAKLNAQGLTSSYSKYFGQKQGYLIDPESENFQVDGQPMTQEQAQAAVKERYGSDATVSTVTIDGEDRLLIEQPSGYFAAKGLTNGILQDAGESKISSAIGARIMGERDGVTWHPLKKLDSKLYNTLDKKIAEWQKEKAENEKNGVTDADLSAESEPDEETTKAAQSSTDANAEATSSEASSTLSEGNSVNTELADGGDSSGPLSTFSDHIGLKITGSVLGAAGVLCLLRGLASDAGQIKEAQVALPLVRIGMRAISEGNQVMYGGSDIDADQLGLDSQQLFNSTDNTSWSSADSIEGELGEPDSNSNGAPDSTLQSIGSGTPFDFLLSGSFGSALSGVCSGPGQVVTTVVSFFGGPVSALGSLLVGSIVGPPLFKTAAKWLAGDAVDLNDSGAAFGNDINYGARLAANDQALSSGGRALTSQEEVALDSSSAADAQSQFDHESLAYKIFSPDTSESLFGSLLDHQSPTIASNLNNATLAFMNIGHTLADLPSRLLSSVVKAAPATPYNYGFPEIGFSTAEMSSAVANENPYQSADEVATLLDNNGQDGEPDYISMAQKCFGDTLSQTSVTNDNGQSQQVWDVQFNTSTVNVFAPGYPSSFCNGTSDNNWLKIRFWIFNEQTLKSAACFNGADDQSCTEVGFGSSSDSTSTSTATSAPDTTTTASGLPTGTAQQLAQQILNNPKIGYELDAQEDVQDAAAGKPGTAGHPISATLLALIDELGEHHTFKISALESHGEGHSASANDPHYQGDAVDIVNVDGDPTANTGIGRTAADIAVISEIAPLMPKSTSTSTSGFGQSECGTTPPLPAGIVTFSDTCSHLHIQIPLGSP